MVWVLEVSQLVLHLVVVHDLVQVLFVVLPVEDGEGDTLGSKSTSSTDSVEIVVGVTNFLLVSVGVEWDIVVDDQLNFGNVHTSGEKISGNDNIDFLFSELFQSLVSLLWGHLREDNVRCITLLSKSFVNTAGIFFGVDEDESLSQGAALKDIFNEI